MRDSSSSTCTRSSWSILTFLACLVVATPRSRGSSHPNCNGKVYWSRLASGSALDVRAKNTNKTQSPKPSNMSGRAARLSWVVARAPRASLAARARTTPGSWGLRSAATVRSSYKPYRSLQSLKRDAREAPGDADRQLRFLRMLSEERGVDAVIAHVEALPSSHLSEAVLVPYLKAVAAKAGDKSSARSLRSDEEGVDPVHLNQPPPFHSSTAWPWGTGMAGTPPSNGLTGGLGAWVRGQAVHVAMAEPSSKEQVLRTLRTLAGAYFLLLAITTIMEERGLVKVFSLSVPSSLALFRAVSCARSPSRACSPARLYSPSSSAWR